MIKKIILLIIVTIACSLHIIGQNQVNIKAVFDKYGKQHGTVYVQLSHDILSQGSNLSLYKSMMIQNVEKIQEQQTLTELLAERESWKVMSEITKSGTIESGIYHLGKDNTKKLNTYLLIKNKNKAMTILYIEGSFPPQRLDEELKKLKDLFIYVNNNKVRLY